MTIDAMGTQTQIASQIIEQGGDYALALKENQGSMYEGVSETFTMALKDRFAQIQHGYHRTVDKGHGRMEIREYWTISQTEIMAFREDESRIREGHAQENLAVLRHLTLNLLRREKTAHVGIKVKRLKAAWDTTYLQRVLEAAN